jgi:hypothetical protein
MAHPYHHALSSVKKWGGAVDDYLAIHSWFDASKQITADFRHRALRQFVLGSNRCRGKPVDTFTNCFKRIVCGKQRPI